MFYVATFFAILMGIFCLLYIRERVLFRNLERTHLDYTYRAADEIEKYWNLSEGYRSNAYIYKDERDDALRCLDVVLTEQAERISRELDDAYDSLSMVLAENEKLRVA